MNFKNFLLESPSKYNFEQGCKQIKQHCQPFLTASNGQPLYRGTPRIRTTISNKSGYTEDKMEHISFINHPENRTPRNSDQLFNNVFNGMIDLAFGVKNIRRKSIFATGNLDEALAYGTAHFCFPKDNFKFINSPKILDSFSDESSILKHLKNEMYTSFPKDKKLKYDVIRAFAYVCDLGDPVDFFNGDKSLRKAFNNIFKIEVPIELEVEPYEIFISALKKTGLDLYSDTDISKAIKNKHEILIYESNGYYMVPFPLVLSQLDQKIANLENYSKAYTYILSKVS